MSIALELESIFDASFSQQSQEALVKCLFAGYKSVYDHCKNMPKEEATDLTPFERWVQLRIELKGVGKRFEQLEATAERNGTSNSYHVKITAGQMMITASYGQDPSDLPRVAVHRETYAAQNQPDLFENGGPKEGEKLYAILLHGRHAQDPSQPGFARIIFPDESYQSIVHSIDLFSRFGSLVDSLRMANDIREPQDISPQPTLKKDTSKKQA